MLGETKLNVRRKGEMKLNVRRNELTVRRKGK